MLAGLAGACHRHARARRRALVRRRHQRLAARLHSPQRAGPGSSTIRRSSRRAPRSSTVTATAISMSSSSRARTSARGRARGRAPHSRFFRNDLRVAADGTRTLTFTDATAASGLALTGYGMGVAAGDYRQRRVRGPADDVARRQPPAPQRLPRRVHRHLGAKRSRHDGVERVGRVRGLRPRRLARPLRRALLDVGHDARHAVLRDLGPPRVLRAAGVSRPAEPALSQQPRRHVLGRDQRGRPRHAVRAGAWRLDGRLRRRRLDRSSTWPTIGRRTSSGSTGTTGRSRTAGWSPARRSDRLAKPKSGMGVDAGDIDDDGDEDSS